MQGKFLKSKRMPAAFFLMLFFSFQLTAQQEAPANVPFPKDLQSLPIDSAIVKMGDALNQMSGKTDSLLKQNLWGLLKRAKATKDPITIGKTYQQMANWHYLSVTSESNDSIYYYDNKALQSFLQTTDKELISKGYRTVGFDLQLMQKFAEAEDMYFKGLKVARDINDESTINRIHSSMAGLYSSTKDFTSALKYSKLVIEAYEKDENTHPLIRALLTLNNTYVQLGEPEKALEAINKAYGLVADLPKEYQKSEMLNVRAWRGKVYRELKRYDEALTDFQFSWSGVKEKYGEDMANGWKGDIGSIYFLQGKFTEAIPYLKDYVKHTEERKVHSAEELKKHYLWLAESYRKTGNGDLAFQSLKAGNKITVNALEQEITALKSELRTKYETEQKDETIASQTDLIEQQKQNQLLSYVIGGLLLLFLAVLFFFYRKNTMKNEQLKSLNTNLQFTNTQLDKRNAENELLLKEIHHRVKNNLEVVSSLLELQSAQIEDPDVQEAMQASQNRVQSMGILHQKLYQSEHLAFIEMKNYFVNLTENILDSYNATERVEIELPMENMELDVDTAVPIGLIVNELLTNALKYAFPANGFGKIKLSLQEIGDNLLQLTLADNGVGKQENAQAQGTGFGTQLVNLLTRQLDGKLTQIVENGTTVSIQFAKR